MHLYAFTIPEKTGWIKIGQTGGDVHDRIRQQLSTVNLEYRLVWTGTGLIGKREITDRDIHRLLEQRGFRREDRSEWFQCFPEDAEDALNTLKEQYRREDRRKELSDRFYEELRNWYYWANAEANHPEYTVRIIIRLLFLFFLREKDIVPKELFQETWVNENLKDNEFRYYKAILCNLFFHTLNAPAERRSEWENKKLMEQPGKVREQFNKIPFLNGGIFLEHPGDDFALNDDYFFSETRTRRLEELGGHYPVKGIIRILSDYKYTLDESDGTELIDPEFIGRMFESLLACIDADSKESRRKITGSYYTPREIVDYMVQECLDDAVSVRGVQDDEQKIQTLLSLKILDPACGSGAFPCAVMNELMRRLDPDRTLPQPERYKRKLEILRNVIYGTDIQPMAVQITVLRLFLSLVQEIRPTKILKDNFGIEPLPNLDYKFAVADTLIPLDIDSLFFYTHRRDFEYIALQKIDFFRETSVKTKLEKRRIITDLEASISAASGNDGIKALAKWNHSDTKAAPYFDSRWMFGIEKFDMIIGNPPYIGEDKHKFIFERYKKTGLGKRFYQGKMDLFYFFFHIGLDMLEEKGVLGLITSNYYLTADGAVKLREDLFRRSEILELVNLNEYKVFESATGQHNIITRLRRTDQPADNIVRQTLTNRRGRADSEILQNILAKTDAETFYTEVSRSQLFDGTKHYLRFSAGSTVDSLLDKIAQINDLLGASFLTNQGVVPGALVFSSDHARRFPKIKAEKDAPIFIYPKGMLHELCGKNPDEPLDFVKPFFKNSDIHRYTTETESNKELLYADGKTELPPEILKYLKKFKPVLSRCIEVQQGLHQWCEFHRKRNKNLFVKPKIVLPYRCRRATFAYNEIPFYAATDVYYITDKDNSTERLKILLGILNSKLIHTWLYYRGKRKGTALELFPTPLQQIPLVLPDDRKPLIDLVNRRLQGDVKAESEIDSLVYQLYGLTEKEINIIERNDPDSEAEG